MLLCSCRLRVQLAPLSSKKETKEKDDREEVHVVSWLSNGPGLRRNPGAFDSTTTLRRRETHCRWHLYAHPSEKERRARRAWPGRSGPDGGNVWNGAQAACIRKRTWQEMKRTLVCLSICLHPSQWLLSWCLLLLCSARASAARLATRANPFSLKSNILLAHELAHSIQSSALSIYSRHLDTACPTQKSSRLQGVRLRMPHMLHKPHQCHVANGPRPSPARTTARRVPAAAGQPHRRSPRSRAAASSRARARGARKPPSELTRARNLRWPALPREPHRAPSRPCLTA